MKSIFNIKTIWLLLLFVPLLSSCHNLVVGKGDIIEVTDTLTSDPFSEVELNSDFTVYLIEEPTYAVTIQGYENLVPHVEIEKGSNKITIGVAPDYVFDQNNIVVYVTAPNYSSIKLSSNGSIVANDSITSNLLEVTNNGSGTISLFGDATYLNAYSAGSGLTRLCAMEADTVNAFMLGSGILSTQPLGKLNAQISGSGQIQYVGSPTLNFSITGSGSLLQALGCY